MATISVISNAATVGLWFDRKAGEVQLFGAAASSVIAKMANDILTPLMQEEAPKGLTGMLSAGLRATTEIVPMGAHLGFSDDVPYAGFVLHGTGLYFDEGGHSAWDVDGLQRFEINGEVVYAMHTHHEGQKPNDYVGRALERAQPALSVGLRAFGDKFYAIFV